MLTFIDEQPVSIEGGTMDEEEYAKSEEFKAITGALKTLTEHCPEFVFSAYTKEDHAALVYNHALGDPDRMGRAYKLAAKEKGEKEAKAILRGTELATHITNLLVEGKSQHSVDPDAVLQTVKKGQMVLDKINSLTSEMRDEIRRRIRSADSSKDINDIIKEIIEEQEDDEEPIEFSHSKRFEGLRNAFGDKDSRLGDTFAATVDKADIDIEAVTKTLEKETGKAVHAVKMSDPEVIRPLSISLANNLDSTIVIGAIKIGKDGDIDESGSVLSLQWQDNIDEIAKKCKLDKDDCKVAAASAIAMSILSRVKEQFDLPDHLFEAYLKQQKL